MVSPRNTNQVRIKYDSDVKIFSRQKATDLVLSIVIIDISLLPMFQVGSIPWKPSLVLIGVLAAIHIYRSTISEIRQSIPILVLSTLLIVSVVVGALWYWATDGIVPSTETLRFLTILVLIPLAFVFGLQSKRVNHSYVGLIIVAVVALNFALYVIPDHLLPGLVNSFLAPPQLVVLIAILAGIVIRHKTDERRKKNHDLDVTYVAIDKGLSIDNSPVLKSQVIDAATSLATYGYRVGLIANVVDQSSTNLINHDHQFAEVRSVSTQRLPAMILKSAWRLNRLNHKHSIKSLYVRGIWGSVVAHVAFPFFNGPELIYDFRGDIVAEARSTGTQGIRLWVLRLLAQLAIRSASKHLSVSSKGATKLKEKYGVKSVSIIPSSTNLQKFKTTTNSRSETRRELGFSDNDIVCVYSGGLARYQMIPEMLAIWNKLDRDNVKFLVLTSNQPGHNIDRSQLELMLPPGAITLSLEPGDVPDYLATADIGFILRQTDPLNTVASPVKFAEYLAAGLAVVTSPGLKDPSLQVQQNGLGVVVSPTPDAAEFATIIDFTERFPAQRDRIRETAITLAQNRYDWSAHLETWRQDILGEVNSPNMETK